MIGKVVVNCCFSETPRNEKPVFIPNIADRCSSLQFTYPTPDPRPHQSNGVIHLSHRIESWSNWLKVAVESMRSKLRWATSRRISKASASSSSILNPSWFEVCLAQGPWESSVAFHTGLAKHKAFEDTTKVLVMVAFVSSSFHSTMRLRSPEGSTWIVDCWSSIVVVDGCGHWNCP